MSNIKNHGGTAFPAIRIVSGDNYNPPKQYHMPGMSLRDYFAAKAMQSFISHDDSSMESARDLANAAYDMADAMLEARSSK